MAKAVKHEQRTEGSNVLAISFSEEEQFKIRVAEALRRRMHEGGISYRRLALLMGVHLKKIQRILSGESPLPLYEVLQICSALEWDIQALLNEAQLTK